MVVRGAQKKEDFYVAGVPVRIERSLVAKHANAKRTSIESRGNGLSIDASGVSKDQC